MPGSPPPVEQLLAESVLPSDSRRIDAVRERLFGRVKRQAPDHYELHEELGRGSFGRVYRATDARLCRSVAIKVIPYESESTLTRLEREAHGLAQLSHPNIVQVYDKGIVDVGTYYLAMEFVDGPRLDTWLKADLPSLRQIVEVFIQAAEGLHHAHDRGLIHRDFKPSNVVVDVDGRVRILDFGLVKVAGSSGPPAALVAIGLDGDTSATASDRRHDPHGTASSDGIERVTAMPATNAPPSDALTQAGAFVGTLRYAAPEQLTGSEATPRSDQFSFCVALFEAIYGVRPFEGRTRHALVESIESHTFTSGKAQHRVPRWLERLLRRGLSYEPTERFSDMDELAAILRRRFSSNLRSRLTYASIGATSAAALIATIFTAVRPPAIDARWESAWPDALGPEQVEQLHGQNLREALENYENQWKSALAEYRQRSDRDPGSLTMQCLGDGKTWFTEYVEGLRSPPSLSLDGRVSTSPERMWLAQLFDPHACLNPEPRWERDETIVTLLLDAEVARIRGEYAKARDQLTRARDAVPRDLSLRSGLIDYQLGTVQLYMSDPDAWHTLGTAEASNEGDQQFVTDVLTRRIEAGVLLATATTEQLEALIDRLESRVGASTDGSILMAQGQLAFHSGDHRGARAKYSAAREAFEAREDSERHAFVIAYCRLHEAFMASWEEAPRLDMDEVDAAFSQVRTVLGPSHPTVLRYAIKVARVFENMNRPDDARTRLEHALTDRNRVPINDPRQGFDVLRAEVELLHLDISDNAKAGSLSPQTVAVWANEARRIERATFDPAAPPVPHDEMQRIRELLIEAYGRTGDLDAAVRTLDEMDRDAGSDADRHDVCDYAKPFEGSASHLCELERAMLVRMLASCERIR